MEKGEEYYGKGVPMLLINICNRMAFQRMKSKKDNHQTMSKRLSWLYLLVAVHLQKFLHCVAYLPLVSVLLYHLLIRIIDKTRYVVMTTKLINGSSLLSSCFEDAPQTLEPEAPVDPKKKK